MVCFTEYELQQHEELIIKRALAAKDLALAQANRHKDELFQKLAEKDRDIAKWKAAHDEMVDRNKLLRDRPDLTPDRIRAHDAWVEKYQQLMEQAVRFAEGYKGKLEKEHGGKVFQYGQYELVAQFLQSPEVQVWKELKC